MKSAVKQERGTPAGVPRPGGRPETRAAQDHGWTIHGPSRRGRCFDKSGSEFPLGQSPPPALCPGGASMSKADLGLPDHGRHGFRRSGHQRRELLDLRGRQARQGTRYPERGDDLAFAVEDGGRQTADIGTVLPEVDRITIVEDALHLGVERLDR